MILLEQLNGMICVYNSRVDRDSESSSMTDRGEAVLCQSRS